MVVQPFRRQASAALLLGNSNNHQPNDAQNAEEHDQTPLDATLEKIGFGTYQKKLLYALRWLCTTVLVMYIVLCGSGWLADNMWLQCVAVIIPRVQEEFGISDQWIGMLSSSVFTGMMLGAWSWGSYSDSFGRVGPFNGTLLIASLFGILAGFTTSFELLCMCFFGLGLGVGGSMPTDGTVFLENLPEQYHYLLTALSVFFSLGSMVTSSLALFIIPSRSCPENGDPCDVKTENTGWRILLYTLGGLTLFFFLCRIAFFKLHESPKYLVTAGQEDEAVMVLQTIADQNGSDFHVRLADVQDDKEGSNGKPSILYESLEEGEGEDYTAPVMSKQSKVEEEGWRASVQQYMDRLSCLLEPRMKKTTLLVWAIWFTVSAAYTIFNQFLPKFLEEKIGNHATASSRLETLQEYCIYTIAGLPGSLVGAALEKRMGRKEAMYISTFATALGILAFVFVTNTTAVMLVSIWISFTGTLMYAIIYGYTPRLFPVAFRGSATGIASALSRLSGMTAPIVTGILLAISTALPLYVAAALFLASAAFMAGL